MDPIFVVLQVTVLWPLMCLKGEENRIGQFLQCPPFLSYISLYVRTKNKRRGAIQGSGVCPQTTAPLRDLIVVLVSVAHHMPRVI
jgi:hypothetical protein